MPKFSCLRRLPGPAPRGFLVTALAAVFAGLLGSGCFFGDDTGSKEGGSWDDFPNPSANMCGDITPAQMKKADSLMKAAESGLAEEVHFFSSDSVDNWDQLKDRSIPALKTSYAAALQAAPNHCGALFAHGLTTAASVLGDGLLDSLVTQADKTGDIGGLPGLAKLSAAEGPAPALFHLKRGLSAADKSLLTLVQEVAEKSLLPRLDTAIAELQRVNAYPDFRFDVDWEDRTVRLDKGELAPILAGLKLLRLSLYIVAGYDWKVEVDESYPYFDVLDSLDEADFDQLTPLQVQALDHYLGLLQKGNAFSRIRAGWAPKIASIPSQLEEIIQHAQDGLAYGVTQAEKKDVQDLDPYKVGTGEDADVDPADLKRAIEDLERLKKYVRGPVDISYAKGAKTLRVDIPKFFRIDGFQGLLPKHAFYPYAEWNDTTVAGYVDDFGDSVAPRVKGPGYFVGADGQKTLDFLGLDSLEEIKDLKGVVVFDDPTFGGVFPGMTNDLLWETVQDLGGVESRSIETCTGEPGLDEVCTHSLPVNPSDLDVFFNWLAGGGM